MLRASAIAFGYNLDIAAIRDPSIPVGVPNGNDLLRFVDAAMADSPDDLANRQTAIIETLGPESLVDAASVFGNFEMMNRVAEGTGIPISAQSIERMKDTIDELGLDNFLKT
ncbi:MAG: hypothetical protein BMS9Abin12_0818 [Acidimicrobiia bacterium]|nr:MAG: hypothetical protein BMS9Abin12_0818 [Acidimicrobiia bacterium]